VKTKIIILTVFLPLFCFAQLENAKPEPMFPSLPFDLKIASENNYRLVSLVYEEYKKAEGDESGFPWSNQLMSFQKARYSIFDKAITNISFYDSLNNKIRSCEYSYIDNDLSVIDFFDYDSIQEPKLKYAFNFAYRDSLPFQKVLMFHEDKRFRLLYDYLYDEKGRLVRLNVTAHGEPQKEYTLGLAEEEMILLLIAYSGDSKTERYYKNMHELLWSERTQYNERGLPINKKIRDGDHKLLTDIIYIYEDEVLVKEKHTSFVNKEAQGEKLIYYVYETKGLISRILEEEGDTQRIMHLMYMEDN
jgi:hypothetical protein